MPKNYKIILEARKAELESNLTHIDEALSEHNEVGFGDSAIEHEDDEVLEARGISGQNEILAINAALARLEDGSFGICISCDEAISDERLDIVPTAVKCKNCMG